MPRQIRRILLPNFQLHAKHVILQIPGHPLRLITTQTRRFHYQGLISEWPVRIAIQMDMGIYQQRASAVIYQISMLLPILRTHQLNSQQPARPVTIQLHGHPPFSTTIQIRRSRLQELTQELRASAVIQQDTLVLPAHAQVVI